MARPLLAHPAPARAARPPRPGSRGPRPRARAEGGQDRRRERRSTAARGDPRRVLRGARGRAPGRARVPARGAGAQPHREPVAAGGRARGEGREPGPPRCRGGGGAPAASVDTAHRSQGNHSDNVIPLGPLEPHVLELDEHRESESILKDVLHLLPTTEQRTPDGLHEQTDGERRPGTVPGLARRHVGRRTALPAHHDSRIDASLREHDLPNPVLNRPYGLDHATDLRVQRQAVRRPTGSGAARRGGWSSRPVRRGSSWRSERRPWHGLPHLGLPHLKSPEGVPHDLTPASEGSRGHLGVNERDQLWGERDVQGDLPGRMSILVKECQGMSKTDIHCQSLSSLPEGPLHSLFPSFPLSLPATRASPARTPTCQDARRPHEPLARRAFPESGRRDSNPGPREPHSRALPDCATPRRRGPPVGAPGFEPGTSASRTQRSAGLSHAPKYLWKSPCTTDPPCVPSRVESG